MSVYLINLTFVYIMAVLAAKFATKKNALYEKGRLPNGIFVFLASMSLVLVAGLRWRVGTDYRNYVDIYYLISSKSFIEVIRQVDPAFSILAWFCSRVIYEPQIMFFISSLIIIPLMVSSIRKYATVFELSMFLYIADFTYYSSFNGMRQWIAASLMFWATRYILKEDLKKYLAMALIASTFHKSALFLLPVYFVVRQKPWSKCILGIVGGTGIAYLFLPQIMAVLAPIIDDGYGAYLQPSGYSGYGVKGIRVIVALLPVVVATVFYRSIEKENRYAGILLNFSLLNFLFMLLANRNTAISRMCFYFGSYNLLLIPEFIKVDKKARYLIYFLILLVYLLYMMVLVHVDSQVLPYQTIFMRG